MPTTTIATRCPLCQQRHDVTVDATAYARWRRRELLIQDAFPDLPKETRELLQTGIDAACFATLFAEMEDTR